MRFPGFEEEWEVKKLGDIANKVNSGKTPLGGEAIYIKQGILFIRSQNVNNDKLELENSTFIPESVNNQMKNSIVKSNDILLNITGASLGRSCVVPNDFKIGNVNQHVCIIRLTQQYHPRFIQPIFSSSKGQNIFNNLQTGSGREGLNFENIKGIRLSIPNLKEQQRIASFLSLIDERIGTQNKIIKELKSSKHSLIKKIFDRELRFKDNNGKYYPEWNEKMMKDLFTFKVTSSFSREKLNYENGTVKNIHYGDIHTKFPTLFDAKKEVVPYINSNINITKISEDSYCKEGDMIFADASEDLNDVGKSIEIINLNNQKILAGLHTILARPISNIFLIGFSGYLFKSQKVRAQIQKESQGSKVLSISVNRLANLFLPIPCLEEQIKIANLFSSMDLKLNTETQILQELEKQKKFFLQQMFV
ncbi:restriction endonuclease subunit S [Chryseobacterium indologenes]|uniref:restriction endonuclease subunit S n=1 Tax=Chryseobacterium indologenes TaxID=253 RepID=UPI001BCCC413|nr:restriction endonuclease subunit S [Chryseobacterium indologenes]